jgi:hypothetical protein
VKQALDAMVADVKNFKVRTTKEHEAKEKKKRKVDQSAATEANAKLHPPGKKSGKKQQLTEFEKAEVVVPAAAEMMPSAPQP